MPKNDFRKSLKDVVYIYDQIDTVEASARIKKSIWFRGPNVWILAFSVIIASVGLNINSTAVIIGAMLISPLMGPIIGIGLALGTNDATLLKDGARNLLIMVFTSLLAAIVYFMISPLNLVNPTELLSRTRPTIYDVLIAFFGGLAGILENSRKEHGTVLSGVAIATALMPPLCTAGYGLAKGNVNFFMGAMLLFLINCVFIILATYFMAKYLGFKEVEYQNPGLARKTRTIMTLITLAVVVPSVWSAILMVGDNNFERNVRNFISENKYSAQGYIYDYKIITNPERRAEIYYAGKKLSEEEMSLLKESAVRNGIPAGKVEIKEQAFGTDDGDSDKLLKGIFDRSESELNRKEAQIRNLEKELGELKAKNYHYKNIAKEIRLNYPDVNDLSITSGASVDDSLNVRHCTVVLAYSDKPLQAGRIRKVEDWLRIRLDDSTTVVHNIIRPAAQR